MDQKRVRRLTDGVLARELTFARRELRKAQGAANAVKTSGYQSEAGTIAEMKALGARDAAEKRVRLLEAEVRRRKAVGSWNPDGSNEKVREQTKKPNTPAKQTPKPVPSPEPAVETHEQRQEDDDGETEEVPIYIIEDGIPRAWRPEDGPIHGASKADTLTEPGTRKKSKQS